MTYAPYPGGTLLIPSGAGKGNHLYVVASKVCTDGQVLALSISSIKAGVKHDTTCTFVAGDHPFITKPSFVYYRAPLRMAAGKVATLVEKKLYVPKEDLDFEKFEKLCHGIDESPFATESVRRYFWSNAPW